MPLTNIAGFGDLGMPQSATHERLLAVLFNRLLAVVLNNVMTAGGAVAGTAPAKVKTVATVVFRIDGIFKTKAATDDLWTLTGAVLPVSRFRRYLLLLDSAGAATVLGSNDATTAAGVTWDSAALLTAINGKAIAASILVATDAATTFTPGTTSLAAAGITTTYSDGFDSTGTAGLFNILAELFTNAAISS